jgi:hypothetical protein
MLPTAEENTVKYINGTNHAKDGDISSVSDSISAMMEKRGIKQLSMKQVSIDSYGVQSVTNIDVNDNLDPCSKKEEQNVEIITKVSPRPQNVHSKKPYEKPSTRSSNLKNVGTRNGISLDDILKHRAKKAPVYVGGIDECCFAGIHTSDRSKWTSSSSSSEAIEIFQTTQKFYWREGTFSSPVFKKDRLKIQKEGHTTT